MDFELELEKAAGEIKKNKARRVLIQLPDGLKPGAVEIIEYLNSRLNAGRDAHADKRDFIIWAGSCYGACDLPVLSADIESQFDMLVHFGHSEWKTG